LALTQTEPKWSVTNAHDLVNAIGAAIEVLRDMHSEWDAVPADLGEEFRPPSNRTDPGTGS
jgi:hypothetical protein